MSSILLSGPAARSVNSVLQPESRPDAGVKDSHRAKIRNWRVIHACEHARDVLPLVEGQVLAGMRPYIVTPQGGGSAEVYLNKKDLEETVTLSLLRAWQDVRNWRKSLLECDPENSADLVHTHSFASGMAGVRNLSCVVYDPEACIEELAISAVQCERGSWMGRSFRVAEQFILSRAKAVIVHSLGMKTAMKERGALPENIFLIPAPLAADAETLRLKDNFLHSRFGIEDGAITFFLPRSLGMPPEDTFAGIITVLEAFVLAEAPKSRLLIETLPATVAAIAGHAERLGVTKQVFCVEEKDQNAVMQDSDVVIANGEVPADPVLARQPNDSCLHALVLGKALLAADVTRNRDCSPEGSGCLWFQDGDIRELGHRMRFLADNPDFRAALGASGRAHALATRNSTAIGQQYDAAYRHAIKQRRAAGPGQRATTLMPITSAG
jgi:glycosyltransferase involved in cell wall biosynthesis